MKDTTRPNKFDRTQALINAIKNRRVSMNLSMRGLAKLSTWKFSSISRLENGVQTNPGFHNLLKLTDALELDISSLFRPDWTFPDMSLKSRPIETQTSENEFDRLRTIAEAIKIRREELGMSTWELGEKSKMSANTVSRIECGITRNPGINTILSLIDALDLDISSFGKRGEHPYSIHRNKQSNPRVLLERQFNRILFHRNDAFNNILPSKMTETELEKHYDGNMFIDLFGVLESRQLPVFIESQKNGMDEVHFEKIVRLIHSIPEGIIIWISSGTRDRFYDDLDTTLKSTGKPIEVQIVEFDKGYLKILKSLEAMRLDKAFRKMIDPAFVLPSLELKKTFSTMPADYVGAHQRTIQNHVGEIQMENQLLLNRLRRNFPYFLNLARGKSNLDTRGIQIGSGINGIEIKLVIACAHKQEASISVRSTNYTSIEVLRALKLKLHQVPFSTTVNEDENSFILNYGSGLSREAIMTRMHLDFGRILSVLMHFVQK